MSNMNLCNLILSDGFPGAPNHNMGVPADGWDNTRDNFKTTATTQGSSYPLGTKITAYTDNTNCPGWYTMMYLAYHDTSSTACISGDFSDGKFWCCHYDASESQFYDTSSNPYYVVGSCYSNGKVDFTSGSPVAIPCATLNNDGTAVYITGYGSSFGWFWVGGVCPCADVTLLQGTVGSLRGACITTEVGLRKGPIYSCYTASTIIPATDITIFGDASYYIKPFMPIGWSCVSSF